MIVIDSILEMSDAPSRAAFDRLVPSVLIYIASTVIALLISFILIALPPDTSLNAAAPIAFTDLQDDGSSFYGKPLITIGVIPFDVNTPLILNQFQVSIGSWLRCTAQSIVHCYDVVGGMGTLAPALIQALQREFGSARICVRGTIVKSMRVETLPEAFEIIERHAATELCGWFSNDMILPMNWMDYVFATLRYFQSYKNFSMHFARRDLFENCRKDISLANVASEKWPGFFNEFRKRCRSRLHTLGYDCYVWNHIGINMTAANVEPFFIGRPNFDGAIMRRQMAQGWFVTAYPELLTYHLEHPDRLQFTKRPKHPDTKYNTELFISLGRPEWRSIDIDIRISLNGILQRRNDTWYQWALDRPDSTFPFGYAPIGLIQPAGPGQF